MAEPFEPFDVLVVGAGPGGIAAAVTAADAGRRVGLVDDAFFPGGQIWRNRGEVPNDKLARRWLNRLAAAGDRITRLRQTRIVARPASDTLLADTPDGPRLLSWTSLILATGARELFLPFPGWTLPGVVGAGGLQALVKQGLPVRGKRIVVAGSGPLLLAVAALMKSQGATVPLILEQTPAARLNRFALSLWRTPSKLLAGIALRAQLLGTRYVADGYATAVTAAERGGLRVHYVTKHGSASEHCDYLACGFGLLPNSELAQLLGCELNAGGFVRVDGHLRTTVPGIHAIGELTGIGGVEKAVLEGQIAGAAAAGDVAVLPRLVKQHSAAVGFTHRLDSAFALRPEVLKLAQPDTIVCRCEDVTLFAVQNAMSGRDAKLQTRCGMGVCQGRICGGALQRILGHEPPQVRPPILVTSIGTLAKASLAEGNTERKSC